MSHYGIILSQFWRGTTGREIRTHGGKDAQIAALYLMSCENATMIGLYPLPVKVIKADTGIGLKGLVRAFGVLGTVGYAVYDARTEHVWVCEMAKFRLALDRSSLKPGDNRVLGAQRLYDKLLENPFLEQFFDRYAKDLHLKGKRRCGHRPSPLQDVTPSQGGLRGLHKPVNRSEISTEIRDQVQGSEIRGSGTDIRKSTAASRRPVENLSKNSNAQTHDGEPDLSATLRDSQGAARAGADERRRGVEGETPRPVGPIGFRGPGSSDARSGDVGGDASVRKAPRTEADTAQRASVATAVDGRTLDASGVHSVPSGSGSARPIGEAANDRRPEQRATEPDARADSSLANRTGACDTGGGTGIAAVDLDADGMGETPGQAELRRTIERLRQGRTQ